MKAEIFRGSNTIYKLSHFHSFGTLNNGMWKCLMQLLLLIYWKIKKKTKKMFCHLLTQGLWGSSFNNLYLSLTWYKMEIMTICFNLFWVFNGMIHRKHLSQCLEKSMHLINGSYNDNNKEYTTITTTIKKANSSRSHAT